MIHVPLTDLIRTLRHLLTLMHFPLTNCLVSRSSLQGNGSGTGSENGHNSSFGEYKYGRFDSSALHIAHALNATKIQRVYDKPIDHYLVSTDFDTPARIQ